MRVIGRVLDHEERQSIEADPEMAEMVESPVNDFKIVLINVLKYLKKNKSAEKWDQMNILDENDKI